MALRTLVLLLPLAVLAQTFDAVSIKPTLAAPGASSAVNTMTGRLEGRNVTLKRCIKSAYGVAESQIFGGPKWVDEDRYDIDAKAPGPAGDHDMAPMMQALLAERFKLVVHRETRALPGYVLTVAKGGLKAKASAVGTPSSGTSSRKTIDAEGCTLAQLAQKIAEVLHVPVSDATGTDGKFDIHLQFAPEELKASPDTAVSPDASIFAVVQAQLGLKLEARKVPTEVVVIDRAEKPTDN